MLGSLSYEELLKQAESIANSSNNIREIVTQYGEDLSDVISFCNSLDSYVKYIESSVTLNKDADLALQYMIEKNKGSLSSSVGDVQD